MINHLKERTWLIDMGQNIILENNLSTHSLANGSHYVYMSLEEQNRREHYFIDNYTSQVMHVWHKRLTHA